MELASRTSLVAGDHSRLLPDSETLAYDGLVVRLSRYCRSGSLIDEATSGEWIRVHFQLHGSACHAELHQPDHILEQGSYFLGFDDDESHTTLSVGSRPGFAVTIRCTPQWLNTRLGVPAEELAIVGQGSGGPKIELGKLSCSMISSLGALYKLDFRAAMRRAYVEARAIELLCELLVNCACAARTSGPTAEDRILIKVERTRHHIDTNFGQPLAMRQLAHQVGTNETMLGRAFRQSVGMTVFEYVRVRRMEEARRLLRGSALSITEVALEVGYEHSCNFSVAYKRHFGVTPKEDRAPDRVTGIRIRRPAMTSAVA